ncbi:hypothetical protein [Candidatus Poriferisodalis sp.]|uniref:hypothetical protein n=1 Tax=Candidatus Poriferisodalis sp. TaxID=3101277 RepID=UPI003C6F7580
MARAQTSWGDLSTPFHLNQASLGTPSASAGSQTAAAPAQCSPSSSEDEVQSDRQVTMDSGTETVVTDTKNVGEGGETQTKDEEESSEPPLTAEFVEGSLPESHSGVRKFTVRILFSEPLKVSYRTLRDDLLEVTNGKAHKFKRVDKRNDLWEIHIKPTAADVSLLLPAATECVMPEDGQAARQVQAYTGDGKPLSHDVELDVPYRASA